MISFFCFHEVNSSQVQVFLTSAINECLCKLAKKNLMLTFMGNHRRYSLSNTFLGGREGRETTVIPVDLF